MKLTNIEAIADNGKYIARRGTDNYFRRCTLLKGELETDFIEVSEVPKKMDLSQYKNEIIKLIRDKYSIDDEFAILRLRDTKPNEFEEYNNYCEWCKLTIKNTL